MVFSNYMPTNNLDVLIIYYKYVKLLIMTPIDPLDLRYVQINIEHKL
jgi:hypothetical protein